MRKQFPRETTNFLSWQGVTLTAVQHLLIVHIPLNDSTSPRLFCLRLRCFFLLAVFLTVPAFTNLAHGADKTIFINKCGQCHHIGGQAPPVNPADKAGLVWIKYFKRQRHPVDLTNTLSSTEMQSILQYLQDHAADSERPIAAVIPK